METRKNQNLGPKIENERKISKYFNTTSDSFEILIFFVLGLELLCGEIRFLDCNHITVEEM